MMQLAADWRNGSEKVRSDPDLTCTSVRGLVRFESGEKLGPAGFASKFISLALNQFTPNFCGTKWSMYVVWWLVKS